MPTVCTEQCLCPAAAFTPSLPQLEHCVCCRETEARTAATQEAPKPSWPPQARGPHGAVCLAISCSFRCGAGLSYAWTSPHSPAPLCHSTWQQRVPPLEGLTPKAVPAPPGISGVLSALALSRWEAEQAAGGGAAHTCRTCGSGIPSAAAFAFLFPEPSSHGFSCQPESRIMLGRQHKKPGRWGSQAATANEIKQIPGTSHEYSSPSAKRATRSNAVRRLSISNSAQSTLVYPLQILALQPIHPIVTHSPSDSHWQNVVPQLHLTACAGAGGQPWGCLPPGRPEEELQLVQVQVHHAP